MAAPFAVKPMHKKTLLQKLFSRSDPANAAVELNNCLAEAPGVMDFTAFHFSQLCAKHDVDIRRLCRQELLDLYSAFLRYCLSDHDVSNQQEGELSHLRSLFGIADDVHNAIAKPIAKNVYSEALHERAKDYRITDQDNDYLAELSEYLGLSEDEVAALRRETLGALIHAKVADILLDGELSPNEERELNKTAESYQIKLSFDEASRAEMERSRTMWQIKNERLPTTEAHINLTRGEVCHCQLPAEWHETRKLCVATAFSGPTMRLKIANGVYWRAGVLGHAPVTQDSLVKIDSGELYLTSKRLIMMGEQHTKTIPLGKILDVTPYSDGIEISKGTGKNPFLMMNSDVAIFAAMLARAIQDS